MTIDFYYTLISPPCRSVLLLAKDLGLKFNMKELDVLNKLHLTPEFLAINPQHTTPTLVDKGLILWESRAILGYLASTYGKGDSLYPKDPKKRALVDQRLYFDIGTLYPRITKLHYGKEGTPEENKTAVEETLQFLETFLEDQNWVAGKNITIADYSIAVSVDLLSFLRIDLAKYPKLSQWFAKVKKTIKSYDEVQGPAHEIIKKIIAARQQ